MCDDEEKRSVSSSADKNETDNELNQDYYFESDHLALRGNKDYYNLLRTVCLLEAQRTVAVKDLDKLVEAEKDALANPVAFVEKLQRKEDLKLPASQKIAELPVIDWEQYSLDSGLVGPKHMTRNKILEKQVTTQPVKKECDGEIVRGRVRGESKPVTFNQLWTSEEQQRLQQLLVEYPPEEVEMRRWDKIAKALGNRTTHQVASRVQKYFIKLAKAGLPVPGRIPAVAQGQRKQAGHKHQRNNRLYWKQSTFLQGHTPPVYMSDDETDDSHSYVGSSVDGDAMMEVQSSNYFSGASCSENKQHLEPEDEFPEELQNEKEFQELVYLEKLRKEKVETVRSSGVVHSGYKCDQCQCEPITGTRWSCMDCPQDLSVDFCDNCADTTYETGYHNSSHRLQAVGYNSPDQHRDKDYMKFTQGDYNYLDPNFMPAS